MNKELRNKMLWLMKKYKGAFCIFNFLLYQMNKENTVMMKQKVIQEALGMSKPTVYTTNAI